MHFIYLPNLPLLTYFKFSKHIRVFWRFFQKVKKSRNSQFLYKSGWAGLGWAERTLYEQASSFSSNSSIRGIFSLYGLFCVLNIIVKLSSYKYTLYINTLTNILQYSRSSIFPLLHFF